jgi:ectoine hydroxylase-related dioxygenase (phytanoyl-CoA dioxygenase family)
MNDADLEIAMDSTVPMSDEDVTAFRNDGWAVVRNVVPREVALHLRDQFFAHKTAAAAVEKERADYVDELKVQHVVHREVTLPATFRAATLSRRMASVAEQLLGVEQVQMFRTSLFEKLPTSDGGGATGLHQDYPYAPVDRSRGLTIWVALGDLPEEMGALRFVEGSHRFGSLGRDEVFRPDNDYVKHRASNERWPLTPPLALAAGDATVHTDLTVHGADPNRSGATRLGLANLYMDPETLYTGAPHPLTDGLGLAVNRPFDHPNFPLLPQSAG